MAEIETEVLVVGAGPTGLMLAYELALSGVGTVVLERLEQRVEQVKGGGIQPRSAELLELRGLLAPILERATPREPVGGHFGGLPVALDCTSWHTRHPFPLAVAQFEIEDVLERRAVDLGARVLRGAPVTQVATDDGDDGDGDGVVATTGDGTRVRARYLVACDGGHSTVRKLLGLPFPGRPGTHDAVLADIRLSAVSESVPRQLGHMSALMRQGGGYWAMLAPLGEDRYRFTFGRAAGQMDTARGAAAEVEHDTPVTDEEITAALRAVYGEPTALGDVLNASRFTDATRQLEQYRAGRVLFAGDAAHIHPPLGGQGLNLGLQDALNLGWKLAATVQGRAPRSLLDSYHAERHPVAAQVLHHTSAQRLLADPQPSEDLAALRDIVTDLLRLPDANRHLAGLMSGLSLRYPLPGVHPLTGQRVPDAELETDAGPVRLSALFAAGHAVLLDLAGALPEGLPLPPRVDLVRASCFEDLGAAVLLIRPDGYVCHAADGPAVDGESVLAAVADRLATTG
ncbi:FAD-dependent monooxygenase [Streptacidiphilus jiangxiensis]|uniref:2-polyprenyl-6-methoxyphenol hydroxylase n=1 Tax=Streptacidiphilus jiangxiensis TaxID=235985 RepID=A0A1H7HNB1_STRJI|nr:FAD-dependent monooxygenase [Streptacidiphilus jiangxiensis]SEK51781.1 2-polyprenyl-6-methoxyphenol hydroxylase [Streptacidiphilus jiangxiensis]